MRKLIVIAAVTAAVLGVFFARQSPAAAGGSGSHGGGNVYDYAYATTYNYGITVCDVEDDNHYTFVQVHHVKWSGEYGWWSGERAGEAGDGDCDYEDWAIPFDYFYVCEEGKACWGPYYTY